MADLAAPIRHGDCSRCRRVTGMTSLTSVSSREVNRDGAERGLPTSLGVLCAPCLDQLEAWFKDWPSA